MTFKVVGNGKVTWELPPIKVDGIEIDQGSWYEALKTYSDNNPFYMMNNHHSALKSSKVRDAIAPGSIVVSVGDQEAIIAPSELLLESLAYQPACVIQSGDPGSGKSMANAWIAEELMKRLPKSLSIVTGDPNGVFPARPGWVRVSEHWISPRHEWGPPVIVIHDELPPAVRAGRDGSEEVLAMNAAIDKRRHGNAWYLINAIGSSSAAASIRNKSVIIDRYSSGGIYAKRCGELERSKMKEVASIYRATLPRLKVNQGLALLSFPARHSKRGTWLTLLEFPLLDWYDQRHNLARQNTEYSAALETAAPFHEAGPKGRDDLHCSFVKTKEDQALADMAEVNKLADVKVIEILRAKKWGWNEIGEAIGRSGDSARKFYGRQRHVRV